MSRSPLIPLALCLLLAGCSTVADYASPTPGAEITPPPTETPQVSQAPRPAPEWGEQVYMTAFAAEGREEPVFSPEYRLPEIKNAAGVPGYEAINAYYAETLNDLAASAAELSGWAVDDYKTSVAADYPFYAYVDAEDYVISVETVDRVSLLRTHYTSMGAPYPTTLPIGDTFDLTTGQRLLFADLFSVEEQEASQRCLDLVLARNEKPSPSSVRITPEDIQAAWEPNFYYLTEDSLVFYFPDGDLPHAVGTPTFAVPYTELEDILIPWD